MFEYILNGFNRSRTFKGEDGLYQFGIDIQSLNPFKQTQDSVYYPTWTPDSKGLVKDTMPGIPMEKDFNSSKAFLRLIERTDSARTENSRKFR